MKKTILLIAVFCLLLPSMVYAVEDTPLTVVYNSPSKQNFRPYYTDSVYDFDVVGMTQLSLLTTDRMGSVVYRGIEGETISFNGQDHLYTGPADLSVIYDEAENVTTYTAKLREDLKFSNGVPVTADDVIFNYYVLLDPSYGRRTMLSNHDIIGLKEYQTQAPTDLYEKYNVFAQKIIDANFEYTDDIPDLMTSEMIFQVDKHWIALCQAIVDYCRENYADEYASTFGLDPEEVKTNDGLAVAFGMAMWGFGEIDEKGVFTAPTVEWYYELNKGFYPTVLDFRDVTNHVYGGDANAFFAAENTGGSEKDIIPASVAAFIAKYASEESETASEVPNISGIEKVDEYTVSIKVRGYDPMAVYDIFGILITPLHYYGDLEQYNYAENRFGHPFGDLSLVESNMTQKPLGAGPYKFVDYADQVTYFEANETYYRGCPETKNVQFKENGDFAQDPSAVAPDVFQMKYLLGFDDMLEPFE